MYTLYQLLWGGAQPFNQNIYTFFEVASTRPTSVSWSTS